MNLLEKLEAEQAAGWPSTLEPPVEPDGLARRRLQQLLTVLASAWMDDEYMTRARPSFTGCRPSSTNRPQVRHTVRRLVIHRQRG